MGAPVCNINPKNPAPISLAPALPSIPVATDLPSLIAAVNALRQLTIQYFNQVPGNSNTGFNGTPGQPGEPGTPGGGGGGGGGGGLSPMGNFDEDVQAHEPLSQLEFTIPMTPQTKLTSMSSRSPV